MKVSLKVRVVNYSLQRVKELQGIYELRVLIGHLFSFAPAAGF